jgi:hypothetical protein
MYGQLPGEAGAAGTSLGPVNPQQIERRVIQLAAAEGSRGGRGTKSPLPAKEESQPSLEDGWLFFFVSIVAEAVSVLKEAG